MRKLDFNVFSIYVSIFKYHSRYINKLACFDKMPNYNLEVKLDLEKYWSEKLSNIKHLEENVNRKKMYILSMFPYPSGHLHLGHMRVYTTADVLARYNRLVNKDVIFPMGWDSFGLPAENAALERSLDPKIWTVKNIDEMRQQMKEQMCLSIDWNRELSTCDPGYFKWTQWLFCRLFEKGFAYQRSEMVNWDPVDKTVLADELIDNDGRSWRSGSKVEKRPLKQWFIRTTALSKSLLDGLEIIKGGQWRHVREEQKGWLGKLEGVYVEFDLVNVQDHNQLLERLSVFTTNPVMVLSGFVAFVEINRDNIWWNYNVGSTSKPLDGLSFHPHLAVRHPLSGRLIPVVRNPNLKFNEEECLTARLGFPLIDLNDAKIAAKLSIPFSSVRLGAYNRIMSSEWVDSEGVSLDNNLEDSLNEKSLQTLRKLGRGGYLCSKLRTDWLISRQRYWGTPIPIIHCPSCGPVLVEDNQLPVELPPYSLCKSDEPNDNATSPLAKALDWLNVTCPKCGNVDAKRETDTMDTFVDSSWYFLRYLDSSNETQMCSPENVMKNMPVDIYIGGMEHAIRHLFYARFVSHFIHYFTDIEFPNGPEPFTQFLPIGLILGKTFVTKSGKYVSGDLVKYEDDSPVHVDTNESLIESWDKMSKSKHNGISPKTVVDKYGLDSTRLIILSNTGPDKTRKWQENDVVNGVQNWERRIWNVIQSIVDKPVPNLKKLYDEDYLIKDDIFIKNYQTIEKSIMFHYNSTFTISVVIANLQKLTGIIMKLSINEQSQHSIMFYRAVLNFLIYLYPLSPLLSSELWSHLARFLLPVESVLIETDNNYSPILGKWKCDLSSPVWSQSLNEQERTHYIYRKNLDAATS